jgi:sarcosine oxidase subunit alpha
MERRKNELAAIAPPSASEEIVIELEGKILSARAGEPLMVTLLAHDIETASRSVKYHRPRGAFCMTGICGQCWMRIGDLPNRAACTTRVYPGLVASRENAFPSADVDVFRAADYVFAGGLDHHRLGTTKIRPLNLIMQDTARRMAGLGTLSTTAPEPAPHHVRVQTDVAIVGAGPAGLAAARVTSSAGKKTVLIDSQKTAGGQLRTRLFDDVHSLAALLDAAPKLSACELWTSSIACGVYRNGRGLPELLVRRATGSKEERVVSVEPRVLILANGGYEQAPLFESNDLPGHYGARALAELVLAYGVLPGKSVVIGDYGAEAGARLESRLAKLGIKVHRVEKSAGREISAARGGTRVKGVELSEGTRISCDLIASAAPVAPAFELARQAGCAIVHCPELGGFCVSTDPRTARTSIDSICAAGDVTGAKSAEAASREGEIAGRSAIARLSEGAA